MTIFQRIMRVRRSVIFRNEKGLYGRTWLNCQDPIRINLNNHERCLPAKTYLHECLHIVCPTMSERNVRKVENGLWRKLTPYQRFLLARKLYSRKWRTG